MPEVGSALDIMREVIPSCCRKKGDEGKPNMAFVHLILMKFWHGAYGASVGSTLFYYVTYVLRLGGWERMQVIVAGGLIAGVTEVALSLAEPQSWSVSLGISSTCGSLARVMAGASA